MLAPSVSITCPLSVAEVTDCCASTLLETPSPLEPSVTAMQAARKMGQTWPARLDFETIAFAPARLSPSPNHSYVLHKRGLPPLRFPRTKAAPLANAKATGAL